MRRHRYIYRIRPAVLRSPIGTYPDEGSDSVGWRTAQPCSTAHTATRVRDRMPKLRHDVIDMTTDRALADGQRTGDLPVGEALGKQSGHLTFPLRQPARAVFVLQALGRLLSGPGRPSASSTRANRMACSGDSAGTRLPCPVPGIIS